MADTVLSYTIPGAKVEEYVSDYVFIHKNTETKDDPEWVDPEDGSVAPQVPKYTDAQWVREHIMRQIRFQIVRGKKAKYASSVADYNADDIE